MRRIIISVIVSFAAVAVALIAISGTIVLFLWIMKLIIYIAGHFAPKSLF